MPKRAAFILLMFLALPALAGPRVLLLNSYHPQYIWTAELTQGVRDGLAGRVAGEDLHIEYMDARRFTDDRRQLALLTELLAYKYRAMTPDLVISSDDAAFNLLLAQGQHLFGDTPVVFGGVNAFEPRSLQGRANFAGILEGMAIEENLALIMRLQPDVKRIVLLGDKTGFGAQMVARARALADQWQGATLEIWDDYALAGLQQRLTGLDGQSAVMLLAIHQDNQGRYFSYERDLPALSQASPAPFYGMWGPLLIGTGVLGGQMNDPYLHGRALAAMALAILDGAEPAALGVRPKSRFLPRFDYRQLQRFGISLDRLPPDSRIDHRPESFYQLHKDVVLGAALLFVALLFYLLVLLRNVRRRRQAEADLRQLNAELEMTVAERTRHLAEQNEALQQLTLRLDVMANTDALTELPNRRAGSKLLEGLLERHRRAKSPFSLALLDLDHFKSINDRFGHDGGDTVLVATAHCLREALRTGDHLCRWGGEEFLLLMPGEDRVAALSVCERLRLAVSELALPDFPPLTTSIGVASLSHGQAPGELLKEADQALYQAKAHGRNLVVHFQQGD
ncbi:diguanylate cyclase [Gallaecimonas sp. GXIMD4217]|uniref:GGDEF domain-containing protein n=1 Tax=Gallaecimonas sp. GXIMD4217 TaxID=3131927 RepID=UPI00311AC6D1